jgi:hypothetical protein
MHEHPSHELSKQAACSLTTKSYEEPLISGIFGSLSKKINHSNSSNY